MIGAWASNNKYLVDGWFPCSVPNYFVRTGDGYFIDRFMMVTGTLSLAKWCTKQQDGWWNYHRISHLAFSFSWCVRLLNVTVHRLIWLKQKTN
jgi:hypothetical protein